MRDCTPSQDEALGLAADYKLIPLYREVFADMLTPVRAYTLLCPPGTPGFLLESVEGGERQARYSFIGFEPQALDLGDGDPLPALRKVLWLGEAWHSQLDEVTAVDTPTLDGSMSQASRRRSRVRRRTDPLSSQMRSLIPVAARD